MGLVSKEDMRGQLTQNAEAGEETTRIQKKSETLKLVALLNGRESNARFQEQLEKMQKHRIPFQYQDTIHRSVSSQTFVLETLSPVSLSKGVTKLLRVSFAFHATSLSSDQILDQVNPDVKHFNHFVGKTTTTVMNDTTCSGSKSAGTAFWQPLAEK